MYFVEKTPEAPDTSLIQMVDELAKIEVKTSQKIGLKDKDYEVCHYELKTDHEGGDENDRKGRLAVVRFLNDWFRTTGIGGDINVTSGFYALPERMKRRAVSAIRFEQIFDEDNDPWREHDFGMIQVDEYSLCWKIDYYDIDQVGSSPDPSDREVTSRVLTIMLTSEY